MSDGIFDTLEPPRDCVSGWRLSRAALGELPPAEMDTVMAHVATCASCAKKLARETAAVTAAQDESLPASLRPSAALLAFKPPARQETPINAQKAPSRFSRGRIVAVASTLALAALVLIVTRPSELGTDPVRPFPTERAKGKLDLHVTVKRGGVLVVDAATPADVGPLAVDDKLRLRVNRSAGVHIVVSALDSGTWSELFHGVAPVDGWLPLGLVVTPGEPPRLRVLACPTDPPRETALGETPPAGCTRIEHAFEVR